MSFSADLPFCLGCLKVSPLVAGAEGKCGLEPALDLTVLRTVFLASGAVAVTVRTCWLPRVIDFCGGTLSLLLGRLEARIQREEGGSMVVGHFAGHPVVYRD